jgi:eukaryotic-like serine/threonine-protein kinase
MLLLEKTVARDAAQDALVYNDAGACCPMPDTPSMIGKTLSHYQILDRLGAGGMGVVYRALDLQLDRPVGIKIMSRTSVGDERTRAWLLQEAQTAATIDHPNVCAVYDVGESDGIVFLVTAFIEGETLKERISRGPLRIDQALSYAIQVCRGLEAAHAQGVVHCDVKTANVMVDHGDRVLVMDFGLARLIADQADVKRGGSPAYMSPEQVRGAAVNAGTDIWALGVLTYEMITGRLPFRAESEQGLFHAILAKEPDPLTAVRADLPLALDSIVRRALSKSPSARYQSVQQLRADLEEIESGYDNSGRIDSRRVTPLRGRIGRKVALAGIAGVLVCAALFLFSDATDRPPRQPKMSRLTSDSGVTFQPAIATEGGLLAYASDRAGEGRLDIWVQHGAGTARKITEGSTDDSEPAISPDESIVAYRSERDGGGIYVVPVLGGKPRLVAARGRRPRFSPDGRSIAYWVGDDNISPSQTYIVSVSGGEPTRIAPEFDVARYPVWSPSGSHLLVQGQRSVTDRDPDWWIVETASGAMFRTGAFAALRDVQIETYHPIEFRPLMADSWTSDERIIFAAAVGDSTNLWSIRLSSSSWRVRRAPQQLTAGSGLEAYASAITSDFIVFASLQPNIDVWRLPVDHGHGTVTGDLERITSDAAQDVRAAVARNGTGIVFESTRFGNRDIVFKDLNSGAFSSLTIDSGRQRSPVISPDGSRIAYGVSGDQYANRVPIFVAETAGSPPRKVCEDCGVPTDWSPDGKMLLFEPSHGKATIMVLNLASGEVLNMVEHSQFPIYDGRFSSDGKWVSFHARPSGDSRRLYIAPFQIGRTSHESDFVAVADGAGYEGASSWAPDDRRLYYLSNRDGFVCLWSRPLDSATKRPVGEATVLAHFHEQSRSFAGLPPPFLKTTSCQGGLFFSLREATGNIWAADFRVDR